MFSYSHFIRVFLIALASTLSCSYAFMLPAATAPNAIVKGAADIKISEMMKIGIVMNIICVLTTVIMINSYGRLIFDFDGQLPEWLVLNDQTYANCSQT